MKLEKIFTFEAAHRLEVAGWSEDQNRKVFGKCHNLHGHSYKLTVCISGTVPESGMVINFSDIKKYVREQVVERYDHSYLNDWEEFAALPTTAENIVLAIQNRLTSAWPFADAFLERLVLHETQTSSAVWEA